MKTNSSHHNSTNEPLFWGSPVEGWYFTNKWNYYQRREGNVASYIERYIGFYRVHVTLAGPLSMCDIETRHDTFKEAKESALQYLNKYKYVTTKEELWQDEYSPHNPNGYWDTKHKSY